MGKAFKVVKPVHLAFIGARYRLDPQQPLERTWIYSIYVQILYIDKTPSREPQESW